MNRRGFISMLAGAAGALVLPKWRIPDPVIFLPGDFSTDNLLYKATERYSAGFTDWRGVFCREPIANLGVALYSMPHPQSFHAMTDDGLIELNEASLETLVAEVNEVTGRMRIVPEYVEPNLIT